ncbi:MAG TPA: SpoIIE family protein phosphatase [Chloroflexaceae bacterium]|nr:SpoIIE family protein phosphatase [Chloroflexaceae bacterium]
MSPWSRLTAWRRADLTRRIGLPAIAVTLLFLAALGFVAFRLGQRAVVDQVDDRNRQLAVQVSAEIATFVESELGTLRLVGDQLIAAPGPEAQSAALLRLRAQFPYIYNDLRFYDAAGAEAASAAGRLSDLLAGAASAPSPGGGDEAVARAIAGRTLAISPVGFRPITGTPYVTATLPLVRCPVEQTPCDPAGAVVAQLDLRSFWTRVDSFRIENGAVTIVDEQGTVIAHPDRRQVGARLDQAAIAPLFAGFEGATSFERGGRTYLAAYAPVGAPLGWGVVVEQDRDAALGLVGSIGAAATLATVLSALSLALLLSALIGRALRPVRQLGAAAGQIAAAGDLHAAPSFSLEGEEASAELVALSTSFSRMIDRLRAAQDELEALNDDLERRVAKRTAQLETVLEVARLSAGTLRERAVLQTLLDHVGRLVRFDAATIRLLDPAGAQLETVAARGEGAADLPRRVPLGEGDVLDQVVARRRPIIVADTSADPAWQQRFGPNPQAGSWLGIPLLVNEQAIGTLSTYAGGPGAYGEEDASLLAALGGQVAVTLSHARLYEASVQRVEQELQTARQIQKHLFPERAPVLSGLDIATYYRPARETTGDFYSFVTPASARGGAAPADAVDLFIGDVSGKSLPAALLMTMARTALYAAASGGDGPVETLRRANTVLVGDMPRGSFVASTFARLDRGAGSCTLVNAAQPAPLLARDGRAELLEGPGAHLPLGVVEAPAYEPYTVPLRRGDLLLFYTDGVIEAFSPAGELFGFERLEAAVLSYGPAPAHEVVRRLIEAVQVWMDTAPQHDDIAILAVRVTDGWEGPEAP